MLNLRRPSQTFLALAVVGLVAWPAVGLAASAMDLELVVPQARDEVPPNCSYWHELWPEYCTSHHQDDYEDGGDGQVTECDHIILDGVRYHITWVGPTYHLVQPSSRQEMLVEPTTVQDGRDPTCEVWHEVYPVFCNEHHVDLWEDEGDGVVSPCDMVLLDDVWYHIEEVGLNIYVEEDDPVEQSTWGLLKSFFKKLLD